MPDESIWHEDLTEREAGDPGVGHTEAESSEAEPPHHSRSVRSWKEKATEKNLPQEIFSEELSEPEKETVAEHVAARPFTAGGKSDERMKTDREWLARRAGRKR